MNTTKMLPLDILNLPLHSRHLIEASAGTGKTYNITRLYVRLLLEKKWNVKQILVMTFTEAATEEIRERIASFIHDLLLNWDSSPCDFSLAMQTKVGKEEGRNLLEIAALELDLASIYTIHGFCQRVIMRFGLSMSIAQQATLKTDFSHIQFTCVCDALLRLRKNENAFLLLQNKNWHEPTKFINEFGTLLGNDNSPEVSDKTSLINAQISVFNTCWHNNAELRQTLLEQLTVNEELLFSGLALTKPNKVKIQKEIDEVKYYLQQSHFLAESEAYELVEQWIDGSLKNDNLQCKPLANIVSTARLKNIKPAHGIDETHPLVVNVNSLLDAIKEAGIRSDHKNALKKAIDLSATYTVVNEIVNEVNQSLAAHKVTHRVIGFDDLITSVAKSLESSNTFLRDTLQAEYPAALVDEFQDTDQHQYEIFSALFPPSEQLNISQKPQDSDVSDRMLVMIGDPKQAIYSFRGGDIFTYLRAKDESDFRWSMSTNYRSSDEVIRAYNRIFYGEALGSETEPSALSAKNLFDFDIDYALVNAPDTALASRALIDAQTHHSLSAIEFVYPYAQRIKQVSAKGRNETKETPINQQNKDLLTWCALETKRLLSQVVISEDGQNRLVMPEDIAILVRSAKQAKLVKQVFDAYNLPTVFLSEKSPLFATSQALYLYWILQAINQPSKTYVRRAITTHLLFVNIPSDTNTAPSSTTQSSAMQQAYELLQNDQHPQWESIFSYLQHLAVIWKTKGVYTLISNLMQQQRFAAHESERQLTNYMHLADELAQAAICHPTPLQLIYWLHLQITEPEGQEASQLRLESDQKLIKLVTQHKSKGLEYPIVFLPFANQSSKFPQGSVTSYHDADKNARTQLGWSPKAIFESQREQDAEDMRLLYVSLTRPVLRTYVGMAGKVEFNNSALMRALNISLNKAQEYEDIGAHLASEVADKLSDIEAIISHSQTSQSPVVHDVQDTDTSMLLNVLNFTGKIDSAWQLSSFSKMVNDFSTIDSQTNSAASAANMSFEREQEDNVPDSDIENQKTFQNTAPLSEQTSLPYAFEFAKGPDAGNYLHDLLEHIDFQVADVSEALANFELNLTGSCFIAGQYVQFDKLSYWLSDILNTPLLPKTSLNLAQIPQHKTLKESEFYFTVDNAKLQDIADLVNQYRQYLSEKYSFELSNAQFLKAYDMQQKAFIKGALHGFIDLIFEADEQYYVADYKSNHLGSEYEQYTPNLLAQDIIKHNYDLQFLIYSLALHRYLQSKLDDYEYSRDFGGVYYLFLRAMRPGNTEIASGAGVFYDALPERFVKALDEIFSGQEQTI